MIVLTVRNDATSEPARFSSLEALAKSCNNALFTRSVGGLGDIVMFRMIFEDLKAAYDCGVHFALPSQYLSVVEDHPFIDTAFPYDYTTGRFSDHAHESYFSTRGDGNVCYLHERDFGHGVFEHRSDLWAKAYGVKLQNHNCHVRIRPTEMKSVTDAIRKIAGADPEKVVAIIPVTASKAKDMSLESVETVFDEIKKRGYSPMYVHTGPLPGYPQAPIFKAAKQRELFAAMASVGYCIGSDTGTIHVASSVGTPTLALFAYINHRVMLKYYSTAIGIQLNDESKEDYMECVPCYNWGECKHCGGKVERFPLPCVANISERRWKESLEALFAIERKALYKIEDYTSNVKVDPPFMS